MESLMHFKAHLNLNMLHRIHSNVIINQVNDAFGNMNMSGIGHGVGGISSNSTGMPRKITMMNSTAGHLASTHHHHQQQQQQMQTSATHDNDDNIGNKRERKRASLLMYKYSICSSVISIFLFILF